jgi:cytoskeletal protein CcmA (bactofilin family)
MLFNRKSEARSNPASQPSIAPEPPTADGHGRRAGTDRAPMQSIIDASLTIVGDLHTEGDLRIDGRICGNVNCAQLILGKDAAITGSVTAEQAIVRGSVTGTIRAPVVMLQETARVRSDIAYTMLAIDDGAVFEGAVHRSENPLEETDISSRLAELQLAVATDSPSVTAAPSNGPAAGGKPDPDLGAPKPQRRNANGHADAQR